MVIDASVVLRWLLESDPDPRASKAMESLDERFALVPVLWHFEVANGLRNAIRAGIHFRRRSPHSPTGLNSSISEQTR